MKRTLIAATTLTALLLGLAGADAQNERPPTVKEVMKKLNFRDTALCPTLGKALKAEAPNWDDVQKDAKEFVTQVEALTRNDPPRGDKASWNKLTAAYVADAKAVDSAAQKKDKAATQAAHAKIANPAYCAACHSQHRNN